MIWDGSFQKRRIGFWGFLMCMSARMCLPAITSASSADKAVCQPAAEAWASYETSCSTLRAAYRQMTGTSALSMARIEAHYFVNNCFMPDDHIIQNVGRIRHLPATIVQGRHDVICPPHTAFELARAWGSRARLELVDAAGHSTFETGIAHALMTALEEI